MEDLSIAASWIIGVGAASLFTGSSATEAPFHRPCCRMENGTSYTLLSIYKADRIRGNISAFTVNSSRDVIMLRRNKRGGKMSFRAE